MKNNKLDSCNLHNIKILNKNEKSIMITMGPACEECNHQVQCKKELLNNIMTQLTWINQVNIL